MPERFVYQFPPWESDLRPSRAQLCDALKALDCLIYQCAEGEQFEELELYREMITVRDRIRARIIDDLPEYQLASWG